jgi:hypothetical protein
MELLRRTQELLANLGLYAEGVPPKRVFCGVTRQSVSQSPPFAHEERSLAAFQKRLARRERDERDESARGGKTAALLS